MKLNQKIFLAINIVGGILVLGSYYLGLQGGSGVEVLWGGVPENIRPVYTMSMLVCAVGYFVFFGYIMSNLTGKRFSREFKYSEKMILILFSLILGASALWMPLVNLMVANPSPLLWVAIRLVLAIVGLASFGVAIVLWKTAPKTKGFFYYSALISMIWFTFHTLVLDAIIWPQLW